MMVKPFLLKALIWVLLIGSSLPVDAQYIFTETTNIPCTSIKSQDRTGTCWSFATTSFIESEIMRLTDEPCDLSEMFIVRNIYRDKAWNYVYRQGKANFSQGSLSHDMIRAFERYGAVPEAVYPGKSSEGIHNHTEMENALKGMLDGVIKSKSLTDKWPDAVDAVLDVYLGPKPNKFMVDGNEVDALGYKRSLSVVPEDYLSLTSFTHHPFYTSFILEIPDNYSNGSYYNIPLDAMINVVDRALEKGYSVAWDGDVSEKGFSARQGIAVLPVDAKREDLFDKPGAEVTVIQANRQANFESYSTTDDHLMHIVGKATDQEGNEYYKIKNSWGPISPYQGFLYMSKAYFAMKTMAIMVHQDVLPKSLKSKIDLD